MLRFLTKSVSIVALLLATSGCLKEAEEASGSSLDVLPLEIVPALQTVGFGQTRQFFGINGKAPYTYSMASGQGTVHPTTGIYTAPSVSTNSVVRVTDSAGKSALALVFIIPNVQISPNVVQTTALAVQAFSAFGGQPPYTFSIPVGLGTVDATGLFTASNTTGTTILRITDASGAYAEAVITTVAPPLISPLVVSLGTAGKQVFSVTGGTEPYTYVIKSGGGTIDPLTGLYTAPNTPGSAEVAVRDKFGFESSSTITIFTTNEIVLGLDHTCYLKGSNKLAYCWGGGSVGQNGSETTSAVGDLPGEMAPVLPAVNLGLTIGQTVKQISTCGRSTCALISDGTFKCWGENGVGQLGLGDTSNRGDAAGEMGASLPLVSVGTGLTVSALAVGGSHACATMTTGAVKCWGGNSSGQLGLGDTTNRGSSGGQMGNSLPFVDLGTGLTVTKLVAGTSHSCALLSNSSLKCWGNNSYGQLGLGDTNHRGDAGAEMGDNLPAVDLAPYTAIDVAVGDGHTCVILNDSKVKCWGRNDYGQLGLGDSNHRGDGANEMGANLAALDLGTRTYTPHGTTTPITEDDFPAALIAAGGQTSCAVSQVGDLKCWGRNDVGQLGRENALSRGLLSGEMGNNLAKVNVGTGRVVRRVQVNAQNVCVTLDDNSMKCWGLNNLGQLGNETTTDAGYTPFSMGDYLNAVNAW